MTQNVYKAASFGRRERVLIFRCPHVVQTPGVNFETFFCFLVTQPSISLLNLDHAHIEEELTTTCLWETSMRRRLHWQSRDDQD